MADLVHRLLRVGPASPTPDEQAHADARTVLYDFIEQYHATSRPFAREYDLWRRRAERRERN